MALLFLGSKKEAGFLWAGSWSGQAAGRETAGLCEVSPVPQGPVQVKFMTPTSQLPGGPFLSTASLPTAGCVLQATDPCRNGPGWLLYVHILVRCRCGPWLAGALSCTKIPGWGSLDGTFR